jgi:hypothetical protein
VCIVQLQLGEMYFSQVLSVITDSKIAPLHYTTPVVALFMFFTTLIGGNIPIFVPFVAQYCGFSSQVNIHFDASSVFTSNSIGKYSLHLVVGVSAHPYLTPILPYLTTNPIVDVAPITEQFTVEHKDARQLQYSLMYVLGSCYLLSGLLYLLSYWQMETHRNKNYI